MGYTYMSKHKQCSVENHADAAILAIQAIDKLGLSPVEKVMVLTTASQLMENQVEAAATAMALNAAINGRG